MLSNVFEACDYEANKVPLEVLRSYSNYRRERHLLQKGIILVVAYFTNRKAFVTDTVKIKNVDWGAVTGVIAGAVVANFVSWGVPSINGMVVATLCYLAGQLINLPSVKQ